MSLVGVTVIVISRGCDWVVSTSGKLIFAPDSTIAALVTMKMIRSTRKMSERIGERARFLRLPSAMRLSPEVDGVKDAVGSDGERRLDTLDARLEVVVENDRQDGDTETERRGNQGFGDARRDHREPAAAHERHVVERFDDTDHRPKQADERRAA